MTLRQRLENLPVGRKLLVAMLVLLTAVLLTANLAFISAVYWISRQSVAPQAMQSIAELLASPELSRSALVSQESAKALLLRLDNYSQLRAAIIYDAQGNILATLYKGQHLDIPRDIRELDSWRLGEFRATLLAELPQPEGPPGHLLLVATSELPGAFYTGTLSASLGILLVSLLFWVLVSRQIRRLITRPIRRLEELSRRVTREENYSLRATPKAADEIGHLADAFNTMLARMESRESQLRRARDDTQVALDQSQAMAEQTRRSHRQLELEVQVRSKIEKKLTGFQRYLNNIIDSMPSALIAVDEDLSVTQWNQQASILSGTSLDDAIGQPLLSAFAALDPFLDQIRSVAAQQEMEKIERITWLRGEEPRTYELTFYPLVGGGGLGAVIRIDDITERIALEEIMVQSEKMRSVGSLAAGMAHEINNPLGAVMHNAQNIRRRLSPELERNQEVARETGVKLDAINLYLQARQIPQLLDGIQQASKRAARIVSHMLSFSRMSNRQLDECQLPSLIEQALEIADNDFDLAEGFDFRAIKIIKHFDPRIDRVPCIGNELEQVLLNLLKNAAQAIHQKGERTPGRIILRTRLSPPWVEIQVEDNGSGMPEHIRQRIFEPFFTTKEVGQGTGLGLSVSYFIITNNHKGQMEVQSRPGQGTIFTLRLPLVSPRQRVSA
ncbi:sensor histidine kinase [Azomonas macrocytogenes]|uniref:histidine kinase n=1 Tax=Azomonas macrocytogenes TaxID=69962 RepID=A0A839T6W3_AZOMA|nr:ATP-binding protein [Azomonas macrocytogenes]MBB3104196.1 PAS domain S-box-containing protein [Azomonas macrocytogenes]